jgi:hypothetical protein
MRTVVARVCACAHGREKGPAVSRAVRNKARNHLERDPTGTNACRTKACLGFLETTRLP